MSNILVVIGATGQQGGAVVNYVLNDSELSKKFKVRGVTRDPSKPAAEALKKKGVEVVQGDAEDEESMKRAMEGAHTVFAITATVYDDRAKEREREHGVAMADAAVAAGVKYFIFSSLPHAGNISGGKLKNMDHFDSKAEVEEHIRSLPMKSAFFDPACFMENFQSVMAPQPAGDGTYAIYNIMRPETKIPLIDVTDDSGKYVGAILAEPDKYEGKVLSAATGLYSNSEIADIIGKATGKTVKYNQVPEKVYRSFMPPVMADHMVDMFKYFDDYGYYGPETKDLVEWTTKQARGKLTTFEEFLKEHPLNLKSG